MYTAVTFLAFCACGKLNTSALQELNYFAHELFIFKILVIAIDWNFKNCTITYP